VSGRNVGERLKVRQHIDAHRKSDPKRISEGKYYKVDKGDPKRNGNRDRRAK